MNKTTLPVPARKPWVRPEIEKTAAGQAEAGVNTVSDGAFTTS